VTLDASFVRLRALTPYVQGRVRAAGVPVASSLDVNQLEALLDGVGSARRTDDERVRVALALHGSVFYRVMPALGAFLADRRVPCLDPPCTEVSWVGGDTPGVLAVCGQLVTADADADDQVRLHDALVAAVEPVVAAFARRGPIRERVLWLSASDTIAGGLLWLGELLGEEARAAAAATSLLRRPGSPFASPRADVRTYERDTASRTVHVRATCCLSWRLEGGGLCSTCPLVDEANRQRLVLAGLKV
jgi:ferric iron reductase protein FhuF